MADEKKEPWLNWLALTTVILAVCATLATFKGGGFSTRSVMRQGQSSDKWAHYQSKSIKGNFFEMAKEKLELELKVLDTKAPHATREAFEARIASYAAEAARYDKEKAEIQREARKFEAERDAAQKHSAAFGYAVIFLQIAILLSSIAALLKQRALWLAGLGIGLLGLVAFANGFGLFLPWLM